MAASRKSIKQAQEVMRVIAERNITRIHTRGAFDRIIEMVKFPETRNVKVWTDFSGSKRNVASGKVTVYKNQQYDVIRNYLIRNSFVTASFDGYRYHYTINI